MKYQDVTSKSTITLPPGVVTYIPFLKQDCTWALYPKPTQHRTPAQSSSSSSSSSQATTQSQSQSQSEGKGKGKTTTTAQLSAQEQKTTSSGALGVNEDVAGSVGGDVKDANEDDQDRKYMCVLTEHIEHLTCKVNMINSRAVTHWDEKLISRNLLKLDATTYKRPGFSPE